MATKRTSAGKKEYSTTAAAAAAEESKLIDREEFGWGVRLTAAPFRATIGHDLTIRSEIRNYRAGRGAEVYITFPAASLKTPLRLLDAQTWHAALGAIIDGTRAVQSELQRGGHRQEGRRNQAPASGSALISASESLVAVATKTS